MANEVLTAWIAAGAAVAGAVAGGALTGWFTLASAKRQARGSVDAATRQADAAWAAGQRQADAAWEAGRRQADAAWEAGRLQADAQLAVATRTLDAQAADARRSVRRAAYVAFLARADLVHERRQAWRAAVGTAGAAALADTYRDALPGLREALTVVRLEGPDEVADAGEALEGALATTATDSQHTAAQQVFLAAARSALSDSP
ncbi:MULTISPECIES: hypothetical protein [unclassified Streptomyces]|uniref:hypothetical protein n=1 Tax=unclassified Streptomyces TaxID=2593676 RepID=UPI00382FA5EE